MKIGIPLLLLLLGVMAVNVDSKLYNGRVYPKRHHNHTAGGHTTSHHHHHDATYICDTDANFIANVPYARVDITDICPCESGGPIKIACMRFCAAHRLYRKHHRHHGNHTMGNHSPCHNNTGNRSLYYGRVHRNHTMSNHSHHSSGNRSLYYGRVYRNHSHHSTGNHSLYYGRVHRNHSHNSTGNHSLYYGRVHPKPYHRHGNHNAYDASIAAGAAPALAACKYECDARIGCEGFFLQRLRGSWREVCGFYSHPRAVAALKAKQGRWDGRAQAGSQICRKAAATPATWFVQSTIALRGLTVTQATSTSYRMALRVVIARGVGSFCGPSGAAKCQPRDVHITSATASTVVFRLDVSDETVAFRVVARLETLMANSRSFTVLLVRAGMHSLTDATGTAKAGPIDKKATSKPNEAVSKPNEATPETDDSNDFLKSLRCKKTVATIAVVVVAALALLGVVLARRAHGHAQGEATRVLVDGHAVDEAKVLVCDAGKVDTAAVPEKQSTPKYVPLAESSTDQV